MEGDNRRGKTMRTTRLTCDRKAPAASKLKKKILETDGPCSCATLHVYDLYGHKMTAGTQLYPTWRCFYSKTSRSASLSVCVCVASASANPWSVSSPTVPTITCSTSLLVSLHDRWRGGNHHFRRETNTFWGVVMFCHWLQRWTLEMRPPSAKGRREWMVDVTW